MDINPIYLFENKLIGSYSLAFLYHVNNKEFFERKWNKKRDLSRATKTMECLYLRYFSSSNSWSLRGSLRRRVSPTRRKFHRHLVAQGALAFCPGWPNLLFRLVVLQPKLFLTQIEMLFIIIIFFLLLLLLFIIPYLLLLFFINPLLLLIIIVTI